MKNIWKLQLSVLFTSRAFVLAFSLVFCFFFADAAEKIVYYSALRAVDLPAAGVFLTKDYRLLSLIIMLVLPFVVSFLCAGCLAAERQAGRYLPVVVRCGRRVAAVQAALVALVTFFTVFTPQALVRLALAAFAPGRSFGCATTWIWYKAREYKPASFFYPRLAETCPLAGELLAMARMALFFTAYALVIYALLLFFWRKSWLVQLGAGAGYYVLTYLLASKEHYAWIPDFYFFPRRGGTECSLWAFHLLVGGMAVFALALLWYKNRVRRDEW